MLLTLAATVPLHAATPAALIDLAWTFQLGRWIVENGAIPREDPLTWGLKVPLQVDQQWLAQVLYFTIHQVGGLELVIAGTALATTMTYALVLKSATIASQGRVRLACACTLLGYALGFSNLGARAQSFAYPIFGLFVLAVWRRRSGRSGALWWSLPPLTVAWANIHGSFPLGLALLGCAMLGTALDARSLVAARPYAVMLALCAVGALITPFGLDSLYYLASIGSHPVIREYIPEWAPTSIKSATGALYFATIPLVVLLAVVQRRRLSYVDATMLVVFGVLAVTSGRMVVWWGFVLAPILAHLLAAPSAARPAAARTRDIPALNAAISAATLGLVIFCLPWFKEANPLLTPNFRGLLRPDTPVHVAEFLNSRTFAGRMFNNGDWGGYFDWAVWPRHVAFVDGRVEIFPMDPTWNDYIAIAEPAADWQARLDRLGVGYLVLSQEQNTKLIAAVRGSSAIWSQVYEDAQAVVFVRNGDSRGQST